MKTFHLLCLAVPAGVNLSPHALLIATDRSIMDNHLIPSASNRYLLHAARYRALDDGMQVEDMLKRSFAEFHAQRAAPEALEGLRLGQQRLAALRARPWPSSFLGTCREAVEQYFSLSQRIEALSVELQVPAHPMKFPSSFLLWVSNYWGLCRPEMGGRTRVVGGSRAALRHLGI